MSWRSEIEALERSIEKCPTATKFSSSVSALDPQTSVETLDSQTSAETLDPPSSVETLDLPSSVPSLDRSSSGQALLRVQGLDVSFGSGARALLALDDLALELGRGEVLGLVGESGSGKSTLLRALCGLVDPDRGLMQLAGFGLPGSRSSSSGRDKKVSPTLSARARASAMQMVFQDPQASLNPRLRVVDLVTEGLRVFAPELDLVARRARGAKLLDAVGLDQSALDRFPHAFSGGQRQRIAIARALATSPALLLLDEAVSALDVSVQAQVLNLLADLKESRGLSYLFVTHDLAVARSISDRIAVMYGGRIVETGSAREVIEHPRHPYSQLLRDAVPRTDPRVERARLRRLSIEREGEEGPPLLAKPPSVPAAAPSPARESETLPISNATSPRASRSCGFAPRCPLVSSRCLQERPLLRAIGAPGSQVAVACHEVSAPEVSGRDDGELCP